MICRYILEYGEISNTDIFQITIENGPNKMGENYIANNDALFKYWVILVYSELTS